MVVWNWDWGGTDRSKVVKKGLERVNPEKLRTDCFEFSKEGGEIFGFVEYEEALHSHEGT